MGQNHSKNRCKGKNNGVCTVQNVVAGNYWVIHGSVKGTGLGKPGKGMKQVCGVFSVQAMYAACKRVVQEPGEGGRSQQRHKGWVRKVICYGHK